MQITTLDKPTVRKLSADLEAELKEFAEARGLSIEVKGGRFDPTVGTYAPKVEFSLEGAAEREFKLYASHFPFNLPEGSFGAKFDSPSGGTFELVGLNPRRRKYPVTGKRLDDGKLYKFPASVLDQVRDRS